MKHFRNILYVSEALVDQDPAFARAVSLAKNNQADLTVIDVIPPVFAGIGLPAGGPISSELLERALSERREAMESLSVKHGGGFPIRIEVREGDVFLETIRSVIREGYDLVIKPAEDPEFLDRLFGSEDMHLLRKCPCPLWLIKPEEKSNYQTILAAVDFDLDDPNATEPTEQGANAEILELACSLAISDFARLHVVHAWQAPGEMLLRTWSNKPEKAILNYLDSVRVRHRAGMDAIERWLRQQLGKEAYEYIAPRYHMIEGSAKKLIPQTAMDMGADLVVMGTVGRTGIPGFFIGNTAETIFEQLRCSVLATKPKGFITPVH